MAVDDLTIRLNYPYLMGVYLGINATADAFILVDGPDCVTFKAEHIHGKHDWNSTLLDCRGGHRIVLSGASRDTVSLAREDELEALLEAMASREEGGVVILCALTMCGMISVDYSRILRLINERYDKEAFEIPTDTLVHDWLDGYDHLLKGYASAVPLRRRAQRAPERVVVVGHLMDRNEGDCHGNVRELERLLTGIGLEVSSVWLSGGTWSDLSRAEDAGTVISLPYGRKAARTLAERLDARLIETGLPFGIEGTARWLRQIAGELGLGYLAERFIDRELGRLVPKLQWVIPEVFLNRRVAIMADPHLMTGLLELTRELGMRPVNASVIGREEHVTAELRRLAPPQAFHIEPHEREWLRSMEQTGEVDLVIANNLGWQIIGDAFGPVLELGFPSYFTHALADRPILGFEGALQQIERMADKLLERRMVAGKRRPTAAPLTPPAPPLALVG